MASANVVSTVEEAAAYLKIPNRVLTKGLSGIWEGRGLQNPDDIHRNRPKALYEVAATPATYVVVGWVKRKKGIDTFDHDANLNPLGVAN